MQVLLRITHCMKSGPLVSPPNLSPPWWECSQLSLLPLTRSWFQGLQTLFQSNNLSKTQQNVALLKEFLTLKNESRLMEEIPPKELNAYISEFIITVRKKDNNEDYEPSSLRSLMARRIQHFCQKPNQSPTFTSPETVYNEVQKTKRSRFGFRVEKFSKINI